MTRLAPFAALLVFATSAVAAPVPKAIKSRGDADRILGHWVIEASFDGTNPNNDRGVWVFAPPGEKSEQRLRGGHNYPLAYSFPGPAVNHLDVWCNDNPYLGIYELDGDTLTIAFAPRVRPTTFAHAPNVYLMTFRRETTK